LQQNRRRRWTAEEKALILPESAVPGTNISDVACRHSVNRELLTVWRRQAGIALTDTAGSAGSTAFVPVEIDRELPDLWIGVQAWATNSAGSSY
jgi:transposase